MTNDYRRGPDGGRGSGRPSSRGRSGYQGTGRPSYNAGPSRGNDPASRLRGSGGPQVHNTRSRKNSSTEWLTGTPLPRRKAVMGFIGLGLGLGVLRLADYQIVEADKLRDRADARRLLAQTLYAKRGTIYDRNGNVVKKVTSGDDGTIDDPENDPNGGGTGTPGGGNPGGTGSKPSGTDSKPSGGNTSQEGGGSSGEDGDLGSEG